jgi:ribosomal protein L7/L12
MSWWNPFTKKPKPTAELTCEQLAMNLAYQHKGNKINAIREFRERTGYGLKESKQYLDDAYSHIPCEPVSRMDNERNY